MKKRLQALRNEEGLTLVELLAVIVILAIIAVVAFVMIGQVIENSRQDAHIANGQQMIASAKLYEAQGGIIAMAAVAEESGSTGDGNGATISLGELQEADMIDTIYDSWDKTEIESGTVHKNGSDYSVTLASTSDKGSCDLNNTSEEDLAKGRKTVCGE